MAKLVYTLTNNTTENVSADGIFVPVGGSKKVSLITERIQALIDDGSLSVISNGAGAVTLLTDDSGGTAATDDTIAEVTDVATAADAIATLVAKVNALTTQINEMRPQVENAATGFEPKIV